MIRNLLSITTLSYILVLFMLGDHNFKLSNNALHNAFLIYIPDVFIFHLIDYFNLLEKLEPVTKNS